MSMYYVFVCAPIWLFKSKKRYFLGGLWEEKRHKILDCKQNAYTWKEKVILLISEVASRKKHVWQTLIFFMFGLITERNLAYGPIADWSAKVELSQNFLRFSLSLYSQEKDKLPSFVVAQFINQSFLLKQHKAHLIGTHQPWSFLPLGFPNIAAKQTLCLDCWNRILYTWTKRHEVYVYMQVTYSSSVLSRPGGVWGSDVISKASEDSLSPPSQHGLPNWVLIWC